jgi:hypothetical protein
MHEKYFSVFDSASQSNLGCFDANTLQITRKNARIFEMLPTANPQIHAFLTMDYTCKTPYQSRTPLHCHHTVTAMCNVNDIFDPIIEGILSSFLS